MRVSQVFCIHPVPADTGIYKQRFDSAVLEGDRLIVTFPASDTAPGYDFSIPAAWCTYRRPASSKAAPKK